MKQEQLERTIGLIGQEGVNKLNNATVLICGLGGVGGTALEALARSGVGSFIIVDFDKVAPSNLNRQILYTAKDIGKNKADCAASHIKEINPEIHVTPINIKVDDKFIDTINQFSIDFIVDAVDDIKGKVSIALFAKQNNIPLITSLGMANRLDASKVSIMRLDKTTHDPLAKKLRYEYKKVGIDTKEIYAAYSSEQPLKDGTKLNSMMMVPSASGLVIAGYVINKLIN